MFTGILSSCFKGWFVGRGSNCIYNSERVEVAVKRYALGDSEPRHYHREATEISVVVSGGVVMNGTLYEKDDVIVMDPMESTDFYVVEPDTVMTVVKLPSNLNDKFAGSGPNEDELFVNNRDSWPLANALLNRRKR